MLGDAYWKMMARDDFSVKTLRQLRENSSFMCNNPSCRQVTVLPTSETEKSAKNGIAAHICAASPGGPRYDPSQAPEERASYENGIWLCANCSILIDRDVRKYTVEILKSWKEQHREWLLHDNSFLPYEAFYQMLCEKSITTLERNKYTHKYIPEIYTELEDLKEKCRFFSDPCTFWNKIIDLLEVTDFSNLCHFLDEFGITTFDFTLPSELKKDISLSELHSQSHTLDIFLEQKIAEIDGIYDLLWKQDPLHDASLDLKYKFKEMKFKHFSFFPYTSKLKTLKNLNEVLLYRIFVITSSAGMGKTNFLCDFSENFLLKNGIPSCFINASELDKIEDINDWFLSLSFLGDNIVDIDQFGINYLPDFESEKSLLIILIDGLNEITAIDDFRGKLFSFIESTSNYEFIKFICTCRDVYFETRYDNFDMFSSDLLLEKNFQVNMNDDDKNRLWEKYLDHFGITIKTYNKLAYEKLTDDPLLLRIYCEVYSNKTIEHLENLYLTNLFLDYFKQKTSSISCQEATNMPVVLQENAPVKNVFKKLIDHMIANRLYINIPVDQIGLEHNELMALSKIINEDVLLKKDLETSDILSTSNEVLNFTFDEFRDFLISNQLINTLYKNDTPFFEAFLVSDLTPDSTIFEGVSKYLFQLSKKQGDENLVAIIEQQPWYDSVFVEEIFDIEEEYVTPDDINRIESIFLQNCAFHNKLLYNLLRSSLSDCESLIGSILFNILNSITSKQYEDLIFSNFTARGSAFDNRISLSYYFDKLEHALDYDLEEEDRIHCGFKALVFFMGGEGPVKYNASSIFLTYSERYPHKAEEIITDFQECNVQGIKDNVLSIRGNL